ncbi:MAG: serine hydrolase domain-containing protein [Sphingomonadaceae bacterium]
MRAWNWVWPLLSAMALAWTGAAAASDPATLQADSRATATLQRPEIAAADLEAWLDGFLPYALDKGRIAGAVVVVVRSDGPVLAKGYGLADVASRRPVRPDSTLFRPGSVSKLLTWTAVMQQVEEGRLDLDRDVNAYLDFAIPPFEGEAITLRHILTHTPGFEESVRYLITSNPDAMMPLGDLMKRALPNRVYPPGTMPAYSNYATALAGYIVERVSGVPLETYFERRIFAPLGMERSTFRQPLPDALAPLMSSGYRKSTEKPRSFEFVLPWPAGSLSATGEDMGRFMIAHLAGGGPLLKPETVALMHGHRGPGIEPLNRMALGFYEQWVNGNRAIGHGGDTGQFHSYLWLFPDADVGLFISVNSGGEAAASAAIRGALFHGFARRYLPAGDSLVAAGQASVDDATAREHAQLLAGRYVSSRGSFRNFMSLLGLLGQVQVAVDADGKLQVPALDMLSAAPRDWVEVAPFVWQDRNSGERLAAEVADGRVLRMSLDPVSPFMLFLPAPAAVNATWLLPAMGAAFALLLIVAIGWPGGALVRRHFRSPLALRGPLLAAHRGSRVAAWIALAAVAGWIGLIAAFSQDIGSIGGPLDWLILMLRVLTPLAGIALLLTSGWLLWLSIRARRPWQRILGASLLVLAALVLIWVTFAFHLYGFRMVY